MNGIPGYSSFWFTGVADYRYRACRIEEEFLEREHARMVQLLEYVDKEFDAHNICTRTRRMCGCMSIGRRS